MTKGADNDPTAEKSSVIKQVIFGLIIAGAKMQSGCVVGWSAVLPKAQADNSTHFEITDLDVTWLVSLTGISGLVMTLSVAPLIELTGPRRLLVILLLPAGVFWLFQAFAPFLSIMYLGRVGSTFVFTLFKPLLPALTSELSEARVRGYLVFVQAVISSGAQLALYVMASCLPWDVATGLCAAPFFLLFLASLAVPESPYWLVRQGLTEEASKSLKRLRGHGRDVSAELTEISKGLEEHSHASLIDQIKQLGAPQHFRPVLFLTSVFVVREFGGQYVVFAYTVYLFRKAGVALDAFLCTILVGLVRFVFTIIASAIADRLGRRPLFISSCLVCFVAFAVGGVFLLLELPGTSWVPLAAVLFYAASYSIGIGIMPWVLLGEVLPTPVRSLGSTICTFHFSLSQFIVAYLFPALVRWTSVGVVLVLFAVMHAILTVMLIFFLPETRGRSLSDLQNAFAPRSQQLESGMDGTGNSRDK